MDALFSLVLLAGLIWVLRYLLPKARRERDPFALACAIVAALVALAGWLWIGVGTR